MSNRIMYNENPTPLAWTIQVCTQHAISIFTGRVVYFSYSLAQRLGSFLMMDPGAMHLPLVRVSSSPAGYTSVLSSL